MSFVYVALGVVALFFGLQIFLVLKMRAAKGKPAPALPGKLGERIAKGERLLFYFYSPTCGACRAMTPVVQRMGKASSRVQAIDISQDMETARAFGIMGTPATLVVDGGTVTELLIGAQPQSRLEALLAG
ncbi:MAG: thioredoxin family protein [Deltaproteobacteria bacterium]|nr:thioredoxin family protein [Deltaproteobacteria bacterium]